MTTKVYRCSVNATIIVSGKFQGYTSFIRTTSSTRTSTISIVDAIVSFYITYLVTISIELSINGFDTITSG